MRPTDIQWKSLIAEGTALVEMLEKHGAEIRRRADGAFADGYPTGSDSKGGGSGGTSDPTGTFVMTKMDGTFAKRDTVKTLAKRMEREYAGAIFKLRDSVSALRQAMPERIPDPIREVCVTCEVSKKVAPRWHASTAQCHACFGRTNKGSVLDPTIPDNVRERLRRHDAPKMHLEDKFIRPKG